MAAPVGMNYGRRPSIGLAYMQNEAKQRRNSLAGLGIPGVPQHRGSVSGIPGVPNLRAAAAAAHRPPSAGEDSGFSSDSGDSTSSKGRRHREHLESALSELQLRIRNDIREELRPLQKLREEVRELPMRILADFARAERHQPTSARLDTASECAPKKGAGRRQERVSQGDTVEEVLPNHGIGREEGVGSGEKRAGVLKRDGVYLSEPEEVPAGSARRARKKFTSKAHELDMWARKDSDEAQNLGKDSEQGSGQSNDERHDEPKRNPNRGFMYISGDDPSRENTPGAEDLLLGLGFRRRFGRWVRGSSFDYISGALVVANAVTLGLQTDWQARHVTNETPTVYRAIEVFFCIVFTLEIIMRLVGYGREFFARQHILWHLFDTFLVVTQLLEEAMRLAVLLGWLVDPAESNDGSGGSGGGGRSVTSNLSVLRLVRILRLIRVMRLMRILRLIGELRTLVMSIVGSLRSLIWAVALLFLMMYVMGVYLTQLILDHRLENVGKAGEDMQMLVKYYGSLGDTVLSVYMSIFGGIDWENILSPLRNEVSNYITPFFMFYIAFATLCMLNVITGVFVESALLTAKQDQDSYMISTVQMVFDDYDLDRNGRMSFLEFQKSLSSPDMKQVLTLLEIDMSQAHGLFDLLDRENTGSINAQDFVMGCARLRGPAKALDLAILMREIDMQRSDLVMHVEHVESELAVISTRVDDIISNAAKPATPFKVTTKNTRHIVSHETHETQLIFGCEAEEV